MERRELQERTVEGKIIYGLPLQENTKCTIVPGEESIEISSGENKFSLANKKITDIVLRTEFDVNKYGVSSIGGTITGAVAGAIVGKVLLNKPVIGKVVGAAMGGKTKEVEFSTTVFYLIISYVKQDDIDYISFVVEDTFKANTAVQYVKARIEQKNDVKPTIVEL